MCEQGHLGDGNDYYTTPNTPYLVELYATDIPVMASKNRIAIVIASVMSGITSMNADQFVLWMNSAMFSTTSSSMPA
jgi:hypothetical protein